MVERRGTESVFGVALAEQLSETTKERRSDAFLAFTQEIERRERGKSV